MPKLKPDIKPTPLAKLYEPYIPWRTTTQTAQSTMRMDVLAWNDFVAWLDNGPATFNHKLITPELFNQYVTHLIGGRKLGASAANIAIGRLKVFFNWATDQGWYEDNPMAKIRLLKATPKAHMPWTEEELARIKDIARNRPPRKWGDWYPAVLVGIYTGLRISDVALLKWDSIDWTAETITLTPVKTKMHRTSVTIPIESNELFPALDTLKKLPIPCEKGMEDYLFPNLATNQMCDGHKTLSADFTELINRAGVRKAGFHNLRHTFISRLVNAGVDLLTVSSMSGHKNLNELKTYGQVSLAAKQTAINKAF